MANGEVVYSVKDLLARQDEKLDTILLELRAKADSVALAAVELRVAEIERHGSSQAVLAHSEAMDLEKRFSAMELEMAVRKRLAEDEEKDHERIEDLTSWRNRLIGALSVVMLIVGGSTAHTWFGF